MPPAPPASPGRRHPPPFACAYAASDPDSACVPVVGALDTATAPELELTLAPAQARAAEQLEIADPDPAPRGRPAPAGAGAGADLVLRAVVEAGPITLAEATVTRAAATIRWRRRLPRRPPLGAATRPRPRG